MKYLIIILYLYVSMFTSSARALEIKYSNVNPFDGSLSKSEALLLQGEIVPGDYEYLLKVIKNDQERFWNSAGFILASPGGDVQEALRIGHLVKETFSSVFVGKATGPCVSACFFIYVAAARREAFTHTLGIHRPYIHPRRLISMSARDAETLQKNVLRQARKYLEDKDVPTNLIDRMFQLASTEVHWLSRNEVEEQLGRRPPWYEQFLIAKCGLDKSIERKYFLTNDKAILTILVAVDLCGYRLSIPEAKAFVKSELASH